MNPVQAILAQKPFLIIDGALATELERRGCDLRDPLWSAKILLESPHIIRQVHADYFAAGADCAITANYQATFQGFAKRGLSEAQAADLMRLAVQLAVEARDAYQNPHPTSPASDGGLGTGGIPLPSPLKGRVREGSPSAFVAASIGPYGAFLHDGSEYRGNYGLSIATLMDFHRPRFTVLATSGADMLACETLPCLEEAEALLRLLEGYPKMTAWFSFSARDEAHISDGRPFADCARLIGGHPQVAAIGINCTAPRYISSLLHSAHALTDTPLLTYPNSGESYDAVSKTWTGESSCAAFGHDAAEWYAAGARLIGGCCRTTPDHIRELKSWRSSL